MGIPTMNQAMALVDDWLNKFGKLSLNTPASDLYRNQINILLCGPPLHGKSSTGNSILGSAQFAVSSDGDTETTTVQSKSTIYEQYEVNVVDCPPAPKDKPGNARKVLKLCGSLMPILLKLCPKGFQAAVIVLQYGSLFNGEEEFVMAMLKEIFGESFIQDHCICVITNGNVLRNVMGRAEPQISRQHFNLWCRSQGPTSVLGRMFRACEYRCVLFDNCTNDMTIKEEQVRQLMSMIVDSWSTTNLLPKVSVNPNMRIKADVHIMIETASRLDEYQNQLKFVANYTSCYKISPDTAQVCVMIFGENDHVRFDFSKMKNQEQLAETLQRAPFLMKSSGTDKALTLARQESFSESGSTRYGVQQMALMLTDGHSTDERKTIEEADKLKCSGAEIIVVGAGSVDRKTLEAIASEPTSVYIADTYDELEDLPQKVAQKTAEKAPEFKSTADILFIMDSSGSISPQDYQKELDFVVYLTECFNIGRDEVLFSVMVFSSDCKMLFDFTLTNHQQVMWQIKAAPHMQKLTNTAAALDLARTQAFTRRCGCRGGKKIAIIITDGCSNDMGETARAAEQLIDSGVLTLAVGVGNVNRTELEYIATLPEDVYMIDNYSVLQTIQDELANKTCKLETAQRNRARRPPLPAPSAPLLAPGAPLLAPMALLPSPIAPLPAPSAPLPASSAQLPAPSAQLPVPSAPLPASSAPLPVPSAPLHVPIAPLHVHIAPLPAPSAPLPAPSAPLPAPSAPLPAPSAPLPAPSAQLPAPSAPLPAPSVLLPAPWTPLPAPKAPLPAPSAPLFASRASLRAPSAPLPAPSAPLPAPSAPLPASSAPLPAPSAPLPASSAPLPAPRVPLPSPSAPIPAPSAPLPARRAPLPARRHSLRAPRASLPAPSAPLPARRHSLRAPSAPLPAPRAPLQAPSAPLSSKAVLPDSITPISFTFKNIS